MYCLECDCKLQSDVYNFSTRFFGIPLCRTHQNWVKQQAQVSTNESMQLYFALKNRGVPAKLEQFDGYKSVDIAIPEAKIHIEVDGSHHNFSNRQALSDLKRTYYSFLNGFLTLRIPNSLVRYNLEETADYLTEMLAINRDRNRKSLFSVFKIFR